jgi:hypothetical protein
MAAAHDARGFAMSQAAEKAGMWAQARRGFDRRLAPETVDKLVAVFGAVFAVYAALALQFTLQGRQAYQFGDFYALWTSAVVTHQGDAAVNFDADALHLRQVAMGMNPHGYNPFPYPPTLLLLLGPLGALPLATAFYVFMVPQFLAYLVAMGAGRWREWPWTLAAAVAPASAITLISGQTGFLSGALMVGGLRLLPTRPAMAGVLFGLLAYKPQLGVLIPVALVAMGAWRAIAAACATALAGVLASGLVYGFELWPLWAHAMIEYAHRFPPVFDYMPTIEANAAMLGAPPILGETLQIVVSLFAAVTVWRVWRGGPTPRASALLIVATFLATPHAFNYDMPMLTAALVFYVMERRRQGLDVAEAVALALAFLTPFLMKELKGAGLPMSFAPLGLMFVLLAWPRVPENTPSSLIAAE